MESVRQKIPFAQKDEAWGRKNIDYFITLASFASAEKREIEQCYAAYSGQLDMDLYQYVLNPYNEKLPQPRGFPAKMRNFPIIKQVVDLLAGEYANRPRNYTVVVHNSDVETLKEQAIYKKVQEALQQKFINHLVQQGVVEKDAYQEVQSMPEVAEAASSNYKDQRAIVGQAALSYVTYHNEIYEHFKKGFFDFLVSGYVFSYKTTNLNEVEYEIVNPLDLDFDRSPDVDFIEDGEWAIRRTLTNVSSVIDTYWKDLTPAQIDELEMGASNNTLWGLGTTEGLTFIPEATRNTGGHFNHGRQIEVIHSTWKSRKKVGILSYMDELGKLQSTEVDETYKIDKEAGESIEWFWVNEVWEGTKIAGKYYVRIRPVLVQRTSLDNISKCKLPYNGRSYYSRNTNSTSMVKLGIPFQVTYNVYKYRLENAIAKSKGKIGSIDLNAKPKDWSWEKWMYYIDALGFMVVDYSKTKLNPQHKPEMDLSFSQYLKVVLELLDSLKAEWWDLAGVPPQRRGEIASNELVGNTERAVVQSSLITEDYFDKYARFERRELIGLLDYSKLAWLEGKKAAYYMPEIGTEFLDIEGIQYSEIEFGVDISAAGRDKEKLQALRGLTERLIQANVPASAIAEIIDSDNFSKIKQKLVEAEQQQQQMEQQMEQMKQQGESQQMQQTLQIEKEKMDREDYNREQDRVVKIQVAEIQAMAGKNMVEDSNDNGIPDAIEVAELALKNREIKNKYDIEQQWMDIEKDKMKHEKAMADKEKANKETEASSTIKMNNSQIRLEQAKADAEQIKADAKVRVAKATPKNNK